MKLQTQLLLITDAKGNDINVENKPVIISLNGERLTTKLEDIFTGLEFDDGEIYGNSLLGYYPVNEDGSLQVEGSKVQLIDGDTNEPILVKRIKRPGVHNDTDIPFEHVQKFVEYFNIQKPEEVFSNLTAEEKQVFISERTTKTEARNKQEAEASANAETEAAAKAQTALEEKQQAEATLKASIDPAYVQHMPQYVSTQSFYSGVDGFKEYVNDKYHLFWGEDPNQSLCILIKRGDTWWEEVNPEAADIMAKTDKAVVIEFTDGTERKQMTLDRESGQIAIASVPAAE